MGVHGIEIACESGITRIWQGEKIQDNTMQVRDIKYICMCVKTMVSRGQESGCNWSGGFVGWKLEQSEGDRKWRQDTKLKATSDRTRRM
jgi:hypothetical protein